MQYLQRALEMAARALGGVSPRPPVGAVIVRDGRIVGEGCTTPCPGPHAEIVALRQAGRQARGATLYVTLEPCSHYGATPPCVEALIEAGVKRVECLAGDPNPLVNGKGFANLRAAGIELRTRFPDPLRQDALRLIEGFAHYLETGRPLVTAKYAMSLDGKIATPAGESQWITGETARAEAHRMRWRADAVMVGIGTVLADDPRLTARVPEESASGPRPRWRVVVDARGRLPRSARMLNEPGAVLWYVAPGAAVPRTLPENVEAVEAPAATGGVDLSAVLNDLGKRGCLNLLVEGGGRLLGTIFDLGLVNRVAAFVAPVIIGGEDAPGPVGGKGVAALSAAARIEGTRVARCGLDLLVTGRVRQESDG